MGTIGRRLPHCRCFPGWDGDDVGDGGDDDGGDDDVGDGDSKMVVLVMVVIMVMITILESGIWDYMPLDQP